MNNKARVASVGEKAPDFEIETPEGGISLYQLAARQERLALTTQDSYRYHPN